MFAFNARRLLPLTAVLGLSLLLLSASKAAAVQLGNPAPDLTKGDLALGLAISDHRTTGLLDWGISESGVLRGLVGTTNSGFSKSGTEFGAGFRYTLDPKFDIAKAPARLGLLAQLQLSSVSDLGVTLKGNVIDLGFGGKLTPIENLNAYGALVYERAQYDTQINLLFITGRATITQSKLGVLLGVEYWIASRFVAGLEIHPGLFDDDPVVFGEFKF